jgi:hypothetical protein
MNLCCLQWTSVRHHKLCCLQWIRFSLPNCVVRSDAGVCCRICVVCSEYAFAAESMLFVANWCSLLKVWCLQRIRICCRNCVVCSESTFTAEILYCLQQISIRAESVMSAANPHLLPKLCYSQRINIRCWNFVLSVVNQHSLLKLCYSLWINIFC